MCKFLVQVLPVFWISWSPLRFGANVRATAYGLHLGLQRIANTSKGWRWMKEFFPRRHKIWWSLCNDKWKWSIATLAQNMPKYCRTENTFRWSTITVLSDPAKLIKVNVHVFSDSTSCVGVSNPDPSNNWATEQHGSVEHFNLAVRQVRAYSEIRERAKSRIVWRYDHVHVNVQRHGMDRKAIHRLVCIMPKKWQHLRPSSSQDTGASWVPRQKIRGGTEISTNPKPWGCEASEIVDICKCHTSRPKFQLGQLKTGGSRYHFQGTFENRKILIKTILASNNFCIYNRMCRW